RGQPGQFPLNAGHIGLGPGDRRLELGHAVKVALVIAALDALLFGFAIGVGRTRLGQARLRLAQFTLENRASIAVTGALLGRRWRRRRPGRRTGCHGRRRWRARRPRRGALNDGDVATLHQLAVLVPGRFLIVGVLAATAVDLVLGM